MADFRPYVPNGAPQVAKAATARSECVELTVGHTPGTARPEPTGQYQAVSPKGIHLNVPKELFVALTDFMITRKCPGSITIQFRGGEILCVESLAKKTYRNNS